MVFLWVTRVSRVLVTVIFVDNKLKYLLKNCIFDLQGGVIKIFGELTYEKKNKTVS